MRLRFLSLSAAVAALLASSGVARAQTATGFAVNRYEPSERGSEWFVSDTLDLRGHGRPAIGVVGEYQFRSLVIYNGDGSVRTAVVRDLVVLHPGASVVLWDRLRLGLNLPVHVYTTGRVGTLGAITYPAPASQQAIGDLRLAADVRLFGKYGDALTVAVGLQAWMPTGDAASYAGDGKVRLLAPRAQVAGDLGPFAYAARLGVLYRGRSDVIAGAPIGTEFSFSASAGLRFADGKLLVGPELYGSTVLEGGSVFGRRTTPVNGLLGAHYTAGDFRVGAGAGMGLTRGFGSPVVHALLSVEWAPQIAPPPEDRDKDGILDKDDACVDVPGVRTDDPTTNGCPSDRDKDGILDKDDACVDVPGVKTDDPKTNGCPPDRDKDGILDSDDACVDVPGMRTDDPKTNGCPPDRDHDGIYDQDDACPDAPGPKRPDPSTTGCPDRDGDGILDKNDACPDQPGKPDPDPLKHGCAPSIIQDGQIMMVEQVKFATASAKIIPGKETQDVLDGVLKVMNEHPEIQVLRVEGHTDNQGGAAMNRKLSADRAASVVKWLVAHGVKRERLKSQGFGPDKPLDDNATPEGRQKNRRVEFHIEDEGKK